MKELKMTIVCKCGNQFGAWRTQCPTCGTTVPADVRQKMLAPKVAEQRERRVRREITRRVKHQCTMCMRPGARVRCPHCNEEIHQICLRLHQTDCLKFQFEREAEIRKLAPGRPA